MRFLPNQILKITIFLFLPTFGMSAIYIQDAKSGTIDRHNIVIPEAHMANISVITKHNGRLSINQESIADFIRQQNMHSSNENTTALYLTGYDHKKLISLTSDLRDIQYDKSKNELVYDISLPITFNGYIMKKSKYDLKNVYVYITS